MLKKILGNKKTVADIILISSLLLIALSVFVVLRLTREEGAVAVVSVGGVDVAEYPLSRDGEYVLNGGTNILVIEDGAAYMKSAECPKQLCVHRGAIRYTGEKIECLHYRVMVQIFGADEELIGG